MQAGDLRHRVTFQRRSKEEDGFGEQATGWIDVVAGVSAAIVPLNGRELIAAQAIMSETTHQVTIRYHPALAVSRVVAALRMVFNGRYFNIQSSLNEDERNRMIVMMASEGMNDG